MNTCRKCGANVEGEKFCLDCGTPVKQEELSNSDAAKHEKEEVEQEDSEDSSTSKTSGKDDIFHLFKETGFISHLSKNAMVYSTGGFVLLVLMICFAYMGAKNGKIKAQQESVVSQQAESSKTEAKQTPAVTATSTPSSTSEPSAATS
ncbi:MAG: hypothetical protein QM632_05805, partial [Micrococcaceae bacterium]